MIVMFEVHVETSSSFRQSVCDIEFPLGLIEQSTRQNVSITAKGVIRSVNGHSFHGVVL
jgi:hypothetical protein